jgi:hypothetical protein
VVVGLRKSGGVPAIAPPAIVAIHGKGSVGFVNGEEWFGAKITFSLIQMPFIAKAHAALIPAFGAERWFRDFYFFIKNTVLGRDVELGFAVGAEGHVAIVRLSGGVGEGERYSSKFLGLSMMVLGVIS